MRLAHKSIQIADRSSIGEARRFALQTAESLGFDDHRRSDIGIVATEAATNVLLHAHTGELLICPSSFEGTVWLDLFALDLGPGIHDIARAREDGFSTVGTAGQGIGAIERLADASSLYSIADKGTVFWARFTSGKPVAATSIGVVNIPVHGETKCGDSFFVDIGTERSLFMMVDGLGHGLGAAQAAEEAISVVSKHAWRPLTEIITRSHDALKKTRGAAMSLVAVDEDRKVVKYAGVGNVSASLVTSGSAKSLAFQNGTLGAVIPRTLQEYTHPFDSSTSLLMYTDGLSSKSSLAGYPGIQNRHPAVVAGILYRDFARKRDDATALLAPLGRSAR